MKAKAQGIDGIGLNYLYMEFGIHFEISCLEMLEHAPLYRLRAKMDVIGNNILNVYTTSQKCVGRHYKNGC